MDQLLILHRAQVALEGAEAQVSELLELAGQDEGLMELRADLRAASDRVEARTLDALIARAAERDRASAHG